MNNYMKLTFPARAENEVFARTCVSSFILQLNPSLSELSDIKTAVSEAITNAVVHAYPNDKNGKIYLEVNVEDKTVHIKIKDNGIGIANPKEAQEPFFTTKPDSEHSGMGFTVMQTFTDSLQIVTKSGCGTEINMKKTVIG